MYNVKLVTKQSWWFLSSNGVSKRGRSILLGYFRSCMGSRIEMTLWKLQHQRLLFISINKISRKVSARCIRFIFLVHLILFSIDLGLFEVTQQSEIVPTDSTLARRWTINSIFRIRNRRQITFATFNRLCLLSNPHLHPPVYNGQYQAG